MTGQTVSWRELLTETEGLVDDRMHATWMCETATSTSADEFRSMLDHPAGERSVQHLDAMVARARTGEPIQYVLGRWGFRHLDLLVDRRVLIPRPETELVAEAAIRLAADVGPTRTVADLGTGSGAIGLSIAAELPITGTTVWITDASTDALDVARSNLAGLGRSATNVRIAEGTWFDALPVDVAFDVIVSNPPYVAVDSPDLDVVVAEWEPSVALLAGRDGLDDIRALITGGIGRLVPGGWLVLEHGHDQGISVRDLFESSGYDEVETRSDLAGHDRFTLARHPDPA